MTFQVSEKPKHTTTDLPYYKHYGYRKVKEAEHESRATSKCTQYNYLAWDQHFNMYFKMTTSNNHESVHYQKASWYMYLCWVEEVSLS